MPIVKRVDFVDTANISQDSTSLISYALSNDPNTPVPTTVTQEALQQRVTIFNQGMELKRIETVSKLLGSLDTVENEMLVQMKSTFFHPKYLPTYHSAFMDRLKMSTGVGKDSASPMPFTFNDNRKVINNNKADQASHQMISSQKEIPNNLKELDAQTPKDARTKILNLLELALDGKLPGTVIDV